MAPVTAALGVWSPVSSFIDLSFAQSQLGHCDSPVKETLDIWQDSQILGYVGLAGIVTRHPVNRLKLESGVRFSCRMQLASQFL
jgi:hypothetical protein